MLKYIVLLFSVFLVSSCSKEDLFKGVDLENLAPYRDLEVVVPAGCASIVKLYGDTLAVCTQTTVISIPNQVGSSLTRASYEDAITIENIKNENNYYQGSLNTWQTVVFEDSQNGDYDYNDLVIHVNWMITATSYTVSVHPVALGSTKKIKLGFEKMDGNISSVDEVIVAEDCRKELFGNREGFINTVEDKVFFPKFAYSKNLAKQSQDLRCAVNWFIEVDGGIRLYAITNNKKCLDQKGIPYGLIFTDIYGEYKFRNSQGSACGLDWFLYPKERESIYSVYDFEAYLQTGDTKYFRTPREGYFDAIGEGEVDHKGLKYCPNSLYNINR